MKTLLVLLALASPAHAESPIMQALFETANGGFQPPQHNKKLQALLAKHPKLTFFEACGVGDAGEVARQLAADGKLAISWNDVGWSALHLAAFSGSAETVTLLLDRGADVHARARTRFKNTALQAALLAGQHTTAKLLLGRGADPLVRQALGFAAIHEAAFLGRRDLVDLLLAHGAELDARGNDGRTALTEARRRGHKELAAYLVAKGAHGAEITVDLTAPPRE